MPHIRKSFELLRQLRKSDVCHGDFHPWNIGFIGTKLCVIDTDDLCECEGGCEADAFQILNYTCLFLAEKPWNGRKNLPSPWNIIMTDDMTKGPQIEEAVDTLYAKLAKDDDPIYLAYEEAPRDRW